MCPVGSTNRACKRVFPPLPVTTNLSCRPVRIWINFSNKCHLGFSNSFETKSSYAAHAELELAKLLSWCPAALVTCDIPGNLLAWFASKDATLIVISGVLVLVAGIINCSPLSYVLVFLMHFALAKT